MNADKSKISPKRIEEHFRGMLKSNPDLEYIAVDPVEDFKDPRMKTAVDYAVGEGWLIKFPSTAMTEVWGPGAKNSSGVFLRYAVTNSAKQYLLGNSQERRD